MQIYLQKGFKMKIFSMLCVIEFFLFLLTTTGNATHTHTSHIPMVLIVKEDLTKQYGYEKIIKPKAYANVMKMFKSEYDDIQFVDKAIDFSDETNKTKLNLSEFIHKNKENLIYIVFLPGSTSKYNQVKNYFPKRIPIITSIGTVEILENNNTWVTTTSSLARGKAIAIKKLMDMENIKDLIAICDKDNNIDIYTNEILDELKDMNVFVSRKDYIKNKKITRTENFHEKNKLILLVSKSSNNTLDIFNNFKKMINTDKNHEYNILLLRVKKEEEKLIHLPKGKIFTLSYEIPGYNPDLRLPFYDEIENICDNLNDKKMCQKVYGTAYVKLHTFLNLALEDQYADSNYTMPDKADTNITKMRDNIYSNITNHNKTNIYFNEKTKALYKFKKENNFYYSSLIESGITNYYIVRLDKENDGFLHYNQIPDGDGNRRRSLSTVYLNMKLSNLIVENLSASSVYIEGFIRIITTEKQFDLKKMYRISFIDNASKKSEIVSVKENQKEIDGITIYEKFYTFKGNFNINNDLFYFPSDKQNIYISFTPRDTNATTEDRYLMHLQEEDHKIIDFDKWKVTNIKPFLSKEIIMFKTSAIESNSSVSYKPVSNFEITIERNTASGFMFKFIFPISVILLLAVLTLIHLHRRSDTGIAISIFISAFAGIISIYFIFNLLLGIESLILFDFAFLVFLVIPVIFTIYYIYTYRKNK